MPNNNKNVENRTITYTNVDTYKMKRIFMIALYSITIFITIS